MATFTLVDGIVLALIALSAILAYARGLARESLSIVGWIAAAARRLLASPPRSSRWSARCRSCAT